MNEDVESVRERLAGLSGSARRLLDYVALLDWGARWAVLRHLARATEEDMVEDLKETVDVGLLRRAAAEPNTYVLASETVREVVLAEIGEERLPKLRAKAEAARKRVAGA